MTVFLLVKYLPLQNKYFFVVFLLFTFSRELVRRKAEGVLSQDSDFIVTSKCRNLGNLLSAWIASQGNTSSNLHYQLTGF